MKNKCLLILLVVFLGCFTSGNAVAQTPTPSPSPTLNMIRIADCDPGKSLNELIEDEQKRGLVLDARPFAINQSTGKMRFNGKSGRVSVVHMNPFVYRYDISVAQEELVSSAVSDFIDILLPQALRSIGRVGSPNAMGTEKAEDQEKIVSSNLKELERRLNKFDQGNCTTPNDTGCTALSTMNDVFVKIRNSLSDETFKLITAMPPKDLTEGTALINQLRDEQANAYTTCTQAKNVNVTFTGYKITDQIDDLEQVQKNLENLTSLAGDLSDLVDQYFADDALKTYTVRCGGFNCARQFKIYAEAVLDLLRTEYQPTLDNRLQTWRQFQAMLDLTEQMKNKEGIFARTFEIKKKFELSAATISVARLKVKPANEPSQNAIRTAAPPNPASPAQNGNANHAEEKADDKKDAKKAKGEEPEADDAEPEPVTPDINESIQIGRPRFLVSGGLVYSPLSRQTFVTATGFTRDTQGNPVGDGNKSVVGFGENSPRRLLPMVFLNSRLASFSPASIYFTLGVTAKKDKDIDVEYFLGPSVSMLNERAMVTFGAYAGKGERLVPDVRIGDEIPESAGDAQFSTKHYTWKPGFSFSYVFSNLTKRSQEGGGATGGKGKAASVADDLKDEIRIGGIPFNLAMGLAYTSLEDQTFAPILGFARDRQGNLTNGQTLTRITGLSTSSNYRLVPLAMLHSRLLNFGRYSFYLTSGVTGKKDDDDVQIEYLLGGSVNLYRRKLFFTFGTFAGKQQVLAGDLFLGGKLDPAQKLFTESRYVWKPAFALSYDISKIMPGGSKN